MTPMSALTPGYFFWHHAYAYAGNSVLEFIAI